MLKGMLPTGGSLSIYKDSNVLTAAFSVQAMSKRRQYSFATWDAVKTTCSQTTSIAPHYRAASSYPANRSTQSRTDTDVHIDICTTASIPNSPSELTKDGRILKVRPRFRKKHFLFIEELPDS
jgi:hypothetical protein